MFAEVLTPSVDDFIATVTADLRELSTALAPAVRAHIEDDVTLEAYNLVAAFIDADRRHTDDELRAFIGAFGPRLDTVLQCAGPAEVRKARLVDGKRAWLETPSTMFEILTAADTQGRSQGAARRYVDKALAVAHAVCSLDDYPSEDELRALDRYRTMLVTGLASSTTTGSVTPSAAPTADGAAALPPARPLPELLAELDALVGLKGVKAEVKLVTDLLQVQRLREERGLPVVAGSRHLVFTGNPGTGKTTVARLLAQIYRTLGVLPKGHLVETDRAGLVAGFVGQTALKVEEVFGKALGGFLLIDEAYALARGGDRDFGQEAIDTLVKLIEDHRDGAVVVAAGYPDEMREFIESNPGLRSRFPKTIAFADYDDDELVRIFENLCATASYLCDPAARDAVRRWFAAQPRDKGFGNGRLARNLFESAVARQASRIVAVANPSDEVLITLTAEDIGVP